MALLDAILTRGGPGSFMLLAGGQAWRWALKRLIASDGELDALTDEQRRLLTSSIDKAEEHRRGRP